MIVVIIDLANLYEERQKEADERHYDIVFSVMQG